MVRLKEKFFTIALSQFTAFQFHYGSVKSPKTWVSRGIGVTFQFHYGSVKSKFEHWVKVLFSIISIPLWFG